MHANAALLTKLFTALQRHDHETMASCYHPKARFRDIAFNLYKREPIHRMWRMICSDDVDIKVEFEIVGVDDRAGPVRLDESYRFDASKRRRKAGVPVHNAIESRFRFEDGLILSHDDDCDAKEWARQAMAHHPPVVGFLAGRIRLLRSITARFKLIKFLWTHRKHS